MLAYILVLIGVHPVSAEGQDIHGLYHNRWTAREGVPKFIKSISSDRDGFLWLGSDYGLYRFDGVAFEAYKLPSGSDEDAFHGISVVKALPGGLWIGYGAGGVSLLSNDHLTTYRQQDGMAPGEIRTIAQAPGGDVWIATEYGLSRFDGKRWHNAGFNTAYPHGHPNTIFFDSRGTLWASTANGLFYLPKDEITFRLADSHVTQDADFSEGRDGRVWFASRPRGVRAITNEQGGYSSQGTTLDYESSGITVDRSEALWITTVGRGLLRVETSSLHGSSRQTLPSQDHFNKRDGLTGDFTHEVVEDREGSLWITSDNGLDQFHRPRFNSVPLLPGSEFVGIGIDHSNRLVIGSKQVSRNDGRTTSAFATGPKDIGCVYADPEGAVWLNSRDGLWGLSDQGLRQYPLPASLRGDSRSVQTMTMDNKHRLWVSFVGGGLYRLSQGDWQQPDVISSLPLGPPMIAFTGLAGDLWFGYSTGEVALVSNGGEKTFRSSNGLDVGVVRALAEVDGRIWVGGTTGIEYLQDGQFRHVTMSGPSLDGVSGIVQGKGGDIWLNTLEGIFRLTEAEITRTIGDPHHRLNADRFSYLDGISSFPEQVRPLPTAIRRMDGRLYFSMRAGIVWIDPSDIQTNSIPPSVAIQSVSAEGKDYLHPADLKLPVRTRRLLIRYTASSLLIPERVHFRYSLDGSDHSWQDVGTQREVLFSELPPGTYTFHVIASNDDGVWNDAGAKFSFSIAPTMTQRPSFRVFCVLASIALLWLLYWVRIQQVTRLVKKRSIDRVAEREDIARDLHDTFLQAIQGLILSFHTATSLIPSEHPGRKMLDDALQTSDRVLQEGRNIVTQLRSRESEDDELSKGLTSAGIELGTGTKTEFRLQITGTPRELHSLIQDDLHQIGREAILNAFRHADATMVEVELNYGENDFILTVKDDGIGIDQAVMIAGGRANHWGLPGMKERAKRVGSTFDIKTGLSIGTCVELRLPDRFAYCKPQRNTDSFLRRLVRKVSGTEHA